MGGSVAEETRKLVFFLEKPFLDLKVSKSPYFQLHPIYH